MDGSSHGKVAIMRCSMDKQRTPKRIQERSYVIVRLSSVVVVVGLLTFATGCARAPVSGPSADAAAITPTVTGVANPSIDGTKTGSSVRAIGRTTDTIIVDEEKDKRLRNDRLQRDERTIGGRITAIDRQLDIIEMRRRARVNIEPENRYRAAPRQVLLERERRNLEFQQGFVEREQNRLEFQRRLDRPSRDPLTNGQRFP